MGQHGVGAAGAELILVAAGSFELFFTRKAFLEGVHDAAERPAQLRQAAGAEKQRYDAENDEVAKA